MSLPSLPKPNPDLTQEQALNMILASIAMEETALSHVINAEGEKIKKVLSTCPHNANDIISVNNSVRETLEVIMQNQMLLKSKMEKVLAHLPKTCCQKPEPDCSLNKDYNKCHEGCMKSFDAVSGIYCNCSPLLWKSKSYCVPYSQIPLSINGCVTVDFMAQICVHEHSKESPLMQLQIIRDGCVLFTRAFCPDVCECSTIIAWTTSFNLPDDCAEYAAQIIVHSPCTTEIKKAQITFL